MRYLTYEDFDFIVNLFNTYPKPLKITFCVREEKDMHYLIGTFDALFGPDVKKHQSSWSCHYYQNPTGSIIHIYNGLNCNMAWINRSNIMVIDSEYPAIDMEEIWTPLCNWPPVIGVYHFNSKSFWSDYEHEMLLKSRGIKE